MNPLKPLLFKDTLRHWYFKDLVKESKLSRERVHHYLQELLKENFTKRIKPPHKMPYYLAQYENPKFRMEKRLFGLQLLEESGLFEKIIQCEEIKTAILFGSFFRGDWGKSSDIDLFFYGDDAHFDIGRFELQLQRGVQVFSFKDVKEIRKKVSSALLENIAKGFNIKGNFEPFEVKIHA